MLTLPGMRTQDLIAIYGGVASLARLLGIKSQAVSQWDDLVPELRQYQIRAKDPRVDSKIAALKRPRHRSNRRHQRAA